MCIKIGKSFQNVPNNILDVVPVISSTQSNCSSGKTLAFIKGEN